MRLTRKPIKLNGGHKTELKEKSGRAPLNAHCFPSLQESGFLEDCSGNNADTLFQPLYGCNRDAEPAANGIHASPSGHAPPDPVMAARGMAFEAGYCAGSNEACNAVKKSLKPDLESFLEAVEDLAAFQSLVAETAAQSVVELAFVMAELVTGVSSSVDTQKLEVLKKELEVDISTAYRMTLRFHPEDNQTLHQAFACSQLQWPEHNAIMTRTDSDQPMNNVSAGMQEKSFENHATGKLTAHLEKGVKPSTS